MKKVIHHPMLLQFSTIRLNVIVRTGYKKITRTGILENSPMFYYDHQPTTQGEFMYRFNILLFLFLFLVVPNHQLFAQLSGSYTIGSGGNYASFSAAVTALTSQGVSGAVTFNVLNGVYNEQIEIPAITGASASNSITFQAQSGDAADVTLYHIANTTGDNYVIRLNSVSYLNFNQLTLEAQGTTYSTVVELSNGANHISFSHVTISGYESATSSGNHYLISGDNTQIQDLTFDACDFNDGSIAIYLIGYNLSNLSANNLIQDCTFNSVGYYALYLQYQNSPKIIRNQITSSSYGIYLNYCQYELEVIANHLICSSYGFYFINCTGGQNIEFSPGLIANNTVSTSGNYGVYFSGDSYLNFYHNSLNMSSGNSGTVGFYLYNGSNNNVVNNS
ncbi:MAG: hypothetical protein JW956_03940, partial [Calditrichaceae bacterium]|nr:hypothetical protein [Calditrichaceae bacterium]